MSIQVLRQLAERGQVATVREVRAAIEEYDRLQKLVDDWRICADARAVRCDMLRELLAKALPVVAGTDTYFTSEKADLAEEIRSAIEPRQPDEGSEGE